MLYFEEFGGGCPNEAPLDIVWTVTPLDGPFDVRWTVTHSNGPLDVERTVTTLNGPLGSGVIGPLDFEEVGGGCRDEAPVEAVLDTHFTGYTSFSHVFIFPITQRFAIDRSKAEQTRTRAWLLARQRGDRTVGFRGGWQGMPGRGSGRSRWALRPRRR